MGHLVNPLLYRLNYSSFWNGSMITNSRLDGYINVFSLYFFNFVKGYFKNYDWVDKNFLIVTSLKFFFINKSIFVYVDFWQHANFGEKKLVIAETPLYFFNFALKKRLLKPSSFLKKKRVLNFFTWKKYFSFKKGLTFFKKKFSFKYFARNFITEETVFKPHRFMKYFWKKLHKFFKQPVMSYMGRSEWYLYTDKNEEVLPFVWVPAHVRNWKFDYFGIVYDRRLFRIFCKYIKYFRVKFNFSELNHFYNFSLENKLHKDIVPHYWYKFRNYLFKVTRPKKKNIFMRWFYTLFFIQFYFYFSNFLALHFHVKNLENAGKKRKKIKKSVDYLLHVKLVLKKRFFSKFNNFKSNFLKPTDLVLLRKKKLKFYLFTAKKMRFKYSKKFKFNRKFFPNNIYSNLLKMKKFNARRSKKYKKKTWWRSFIYSNYLKKKKLPRSVYEYKKNFRIFKKKKSFFSNFMFRSNKKLFKKLKKKIKNSSKAFKPIIKKKKIKLVSYAFRWRKKRRIFKKKRILKKKSKRKIFLKKKNFTYKIKFSSISKKFGFYLDRFKKKFYYIRKRRDYPFYMKRIQYVRKLIFNNNLLFVKKKIPSLKLKRIFQKKTFMRLAKKQKQRVWLAAQISKFPSEEAYYANVRKIKRNKMLKKSFFNKFGLAQIRHKSLWASLGTMLEFTKTYDRKLRFLKHRRLKAVSKITHKKLNYFNAKFRLLFNYFYFYSKICSVKNNFILHVSILTGYFTKINLTIFIQSHFNFEVNADLVGDFLVLWFLKKKFVIKEILGTLLNYLNKVYASKGIGGYAILMKGRFTRKDRAMYSWKKVGPMPLSHRIATVDYCNRWVPLRFSQCAFKIYLLQFDSKYIRKKHRNVRRKYELRNAYLWNWKDGDYIALENIYEEIDEEID